ncbi:MAG: MSMEG_4193 family putative phosphomutase [Caldilineales bacterium]
MTDVLLVRHAANDWAGQRLAGRTAGVHLNEQGRNQAAALAERLHGWSFAALYSSPLTRALETAQAVAAPRGQVVLPEQGLIELDYGAWTGSTLAELAQKPEWHAVQHSPSLFSFPEGEAMAAMQQRAVAAVERLRQQHEQQTIALFSHADVIKAIVAWYAGVPFDLFQRLVIDTASVTWLHYTKSGPYLLRLNDTGLLTAPSRPTA